MGLFAAKLGEELEVSVLWVELYIYSSVADAGNVKGWFLKDNEPDW